MSRSTARHSKGPHASEPSKEWQQAFLEHVRKTGEPETFPDIEREPPPEGSRPRILARFDVDRKKRPNRDMAPCALCSPYHEKCLEGLCLVWYPDEGVVRVIGPECGDGLEGGALLNAERKDFERRQRQARAEEFLLENLPKTGALLAALHALRPALSEAERLHHKLRHDYSEIPKRLRQVKKNGGILTVNVTIKKQKREDDEEGGERGERVGPRGFGKGSDGIDTYTESFGALDGATMFLSSYEPLLELDQIIALGTALPQVATVESSFDWLCENESLELFEQVVENMRDLQAGIQRLIEQLSSVYAFFRPENLARLNAWGMHPEADFRLSVSVEDGVYTLEHGGRRSRLMPDFSVLSALSTLPSYDK